VLRRRGGALFAGGQAEVVIENSTFEANWGSFGGKHSNSWEVFAQHCPLPSHPRCWRVCLTPCLCAGCAPDLPVVWCTAGAVYAAGSSNVTISRSVLASNYVKDYWSAASGGACCVNHSATLSLINTTVRNNDAQMKGGGVSMESKRCAWLCGLAGWHDWGQHQDSL
jgi:hypothetical protein